MTFCPFEVGSLFLEASMDVLTAFLSMTLAISIAAERMVEILKGMLPNLGLFKMNPDAAKESQRCAWIHVLAGGCGALVAWLGNLNIFSGLSGGGTIQPWISYAGAGLLASGGSAFWNHALDMIKAAKITQEQGAIAAVNANQQKSLLLAAHPDSFAEVMLPTEEAHQDARSAAAPAGCAIRLDPATGDFHAPKGQLTFKLTGIVGSFNFVPLGCRVTDGSGKQITLTTATISQLAFPATTVGTYKFSVLYSCTSESTANLTEDCTGATFSLPLDDTLQGQIHYTIQVS